MAISVQAIYNDIADEMGPGLGSTTLQGKVIRALNRTLDTLSNRQDRSSAYTRINDLNDTISQIDDELEYVLWAGTRYFLARMGARPGDPRIAKVVFEDSASVWEGAIGDFIAQVSNGNQASSYDDETDIVGWGYRVENDSD